MGNINWKKILNKLEIKLGRDDLKYKTLLYEGRARPQISSKDFEDKYVQQVWSFPRDTGGMEEAIGDVEWLEPGGYVVFSTDITPQVDNLDSIKNVMERLLKLNVEKLKAKGVSVGQRLVRNKRIEKTIQQLSKEEKQDFGFSVGNMFRGHYYDQEQNHLWSEKSLSVEIRDVSPETLKKIAVELGQAFDQYKVMVFDSAANRPYMLTTKD